MLHLYILFFGIFKPTELRPIHSWGVDENKSLIVNPKLMSLLSSHVYTQCGTQPSCSELAHILNTTTVYIDPVITKNLYMYTVCSLYDYGYTERYNKTEKEHAAECLKNASNFYHTLTLNCIQISYNEKLNTILQSFVHFVDKSLTTTFSSKWDMPSYSFFSVHDEPLPHTIQNII